MKIDVVTSFSAEGWEQYGRRCVESFSQYWPREIQLFVYSEEAEELPASVDWFSWRVRWFPLLNLGTVSAFLQKHGLDPKKHGIVPGWKKENFRFNACKFMRKVFAVADCALRTDADRLFWLDADTVTFAPVPMAFLESLLPDSYYLCHLGRGDRYHSECGFMGFNVKHPAHQEFMERYAGMYGTGRFEQEKEWHDSYLFDVVRKEMEREGKIQSYNLSPKGQGHVFIQSGLGQYMDHMKGGFRKALGSSVKNDLPTARSEEYWQKIPEKPEGA